MPDLLVKLYDLPDAESRGKSAAGEPIRVRSAMAYEKHQVLDWVCARFGRGWASECDVAFANRPVSCYVATENSKIVGFACFDSTCKGFFGPLGVAEEARGLGLGTALLVACLRAMLANGYAYAIIGGASSLEFYAKAVGAIEIPGSSPGIYRDRLKS